MDRYYYNLKFGCKNKDCKGIFCRKYSSEDTLKETIIKLMGYGDKLTCEKIAEFLAKPGRIRHSSNIIRGYFYIEKLIYKNLNSENVLILKKTRKTKKKKDPISIKDDIIQKTDNKGLKGKNEKNSKEIPAEQLKKPFNSITKNIIEDSSDSEVLEDDIEEYWRMKTLEAIGLKNLKSGEDLKDKTGKSIEKSNFVQNEVNTKEKKHDSGCTCIECRKEENSVSILDLCYCETCSMEYEECEIKTRYDETSCICIPGISCPHHRNSESHDLPRELEYKYRNISKDVEIGIINEEGTKTDKEELGFGIPEGLNHTFCKTYKEVKGESDLYILKGIIYLFIERFNRGRPNFNMALVIMRLFNILNRSGENIEYKYYKDIEKVFEHLATHINCISAINKAYKNTGCKWGDCMFELRFTLDDFHEAMRIFSATLNGFESPDIRMYPFLRPMLSSYLMLYKINRKLNIVSYESFYLNELCSRINPKYEYRFLRCGEKSIACYGFIQPPSVKSEFLRMINSEAMKENLQDAFFRSLFEGITDPYLEIEVRRENLYSDVLSIVKDIKPQDLRKQLKVRFFEEEGVDSGGITKEFFQLISNELVKDREVFEMKFTSLWIKENANLEKLYLCGKLFGMALYNGAILNMPFPPVFFKKILGIKYDFEDLRYIEPVLYTSLMNLSKCKSEEILAADLYFVIERDTGVVEIIPNGSKIQICRSNVDIFCKACVDYYVTVCIDNEFEKFMEGFRSVVMLQTISSLYPKELESIIIGIDEIDTEDIINNTMYVGYTNESRIIQDLWEIFKEYSLEEKRRFLQFITGNDRITVGGGYSLNLIVTRNGCDTGRLPSAHTCFNTLLLPEYKSKKKLFEKLNKALKLTAGFFLV